MKKYFSQYWITSLQSLASIEVMPVSILISTFGMPGGAWRIDLKNLNWTTSSFLIAEVMLIGSPYSSGLRDLSLNILSAVVVHLPPLKKKKIWIAPVFLLTLLNAELILLDLDPFSWNTTPSNRSKELAVYVPVIYSRRSFSENYFLKFGVIYLQVVVQEMHIWS